jgi:hypothetical protein
MEEPLMADIDTTIGNIAGTAVGVGVAVWGLNAVTKQLDRGMSKPKKRKVVYRKTIVPYPKSGRKGNLQFDFWGG